MAKKKQIEFRITINAQLREYLERIIEWNDNDPVGKIFYLDVAALIKKKHAEIPATFLGDKENPPQRRVSH